MSGGPETNTMLLEQSNLEHKVTHKKNKLHASIGAYITYTVQTIEVSPSLFFLWFLDYFAQKD